MEGEESPALCLLGTSDPIAPKRLSQSLSSGFGCECTVGEVFHPLCTPHRSGPHRLPSTQEGRRGGGDLPPAAAQLRVVRTQ